MKVCKRINLYAYVCICLYPDTPKKIFDCSDFHFKNAHMYELAHKFPCMNSHVHDGENYLHKKTDHINESTQTPGYDRKC